MYRSFSFVKQEPSSFRALTFFVTSDSSSLLIYYTLIISRVTLANGMESNPSAENTERFSISNQKCNPESASCLFVSYISGTSTLPFLNLIDLLIIMQHKTVTPIFVSNVMGYKLHDEIIILISQENNNWRQIALYLHAPIQQQFLTKNKVILVNEGGHFNLYIEVELLAHVRLFLTLDQFYTHLLESYLESP